MSHPLGLVLQSGFRRDLSGRSVTFWGDITNQYNLILNEASSVNSRTVPQQQPLDHKASHFGSCVGLILIISFSMWRRTESYRQYSGQILPIMQIFSLTVQPSDSGDELNDMGVLS